MAKEDVIKKVEAVIAAPTACAELKDAAQKYLDAVDTAAQQEAAASLIAELREDVCTLSHVREFFASEAGAQVFGKERAAEMTALADQKLAAGETICFCPGCQAGQAVLDIADEL